MEARQIKITDRINNSNKSTKTGYLIQLGARKDEKGARRMMQRVVRENKDILGKRRQHIVKADLGKKGIFYRLRIGPFHSKEQSDQTCFNLKSRGADCFVIYAK